MGEVPAYAEGLYEVAPDTYAWLVPNGSWGETNLGLVRCGDRSVLIDTCWDLPHMRQMLSVCQPVLNASPIAHVINTHADGDHCWGNQLFAEHPIWATKACVDQMHHHPPRQLRALQLGATLMARVPVGGVDALGRYMGDMLRPYDFRGVEVLPASEVFSGERTLSVNGVDFLLAEVGPGHTDGDCIVHVPERGVVYTGDVLFVGVTPVAWAGPVGHIVDALQKIAALDVSVIVPGHGPLADRADVQAQIQYWLWVQTAVGEAARRGASPLQAARECLGSREFLASPASAWLAPERLFTSACTLYREWGIDVSRWPGAIGALDHFRQQASLVA